MAQVLVRGLEQVIVDRLKAKAKAAGTSLEDVARKALRDAAKPSREEILTEIDCIRALSTPTSFDSTSYIRSMRDRGWRSD